MTGIEQSLSDAGFSVLVEAAGIEPASRNHSARVSTHVVNLLALADLPPIDRVHVGQPVEIRDFRIPPGTTGPRHRGYACFSCTEAAPQAGATTVWPLVMQPLRMPVVCRHVYCRQGFYEAAWQPRCATPASRVRSKPFRPHFYFINCT